MLNSVALYTSFFALTSCSIFAEAANAIQVTVPPSPPTHNTVDPNFLGVSVELSFAGQYCKSFSSPSTFDVNTVK